MIIGLFHLLVGILPQFWEMAQPAFLPVISCLCAPHIPAALGYVPCFLPVQECEFIPPRLCLGVLNLAYTLKPKGLPRLHMSPSTLQEIQSLIWGAGGFGVTPVCGQRITALAAFLACMPFSLPGWMEAYLRGAAPMAPPPGSDT